MKDKIKMNPHSMNIKEEQKEKLKQLFPEVFNEEKIDFDKLKLSLGEDIDAGRERYGMNWPGKAQAIKVAQLPSFATLKPDEKASVDFDKTKNLFIEGDNLEVLKLLQKSYFGKIKMIYLDPPYNTGKEFIYPDKYEEGLQTYLQYTGQIDSEGKKFSTNVETDGRFHSKWMNMMWPRLFLARNLLKEDGVIFISINDHEIDNLKKICNEVFGEENFQYQLSVVNNLNGNDNSSGMMETQEYCLIFSKNSDAFQMGVLNVDDENEFEKWEIDEEGYWKEGGSLKATGINAPRKARPNLFFPIYIDEKTLEFSLIQDKNFSFELLPITKEEEMSWYWKREKFLRDKNEVIIKKTVDGYSLYKKQRPSLGDLPSKRGKTTFYKPPYSNSHSSATIKGLFNGKKIFDYSKSVDLIKDFLQLGSQKNEIILDFFAGSGTTAHAAIQLNAEDNGNRRFIMSQLPEPIGDETEAYKMGYKNIAEIGEERIKRVGKKIIDENKDNKEFDLAKFDKGFKVFKLDKSNFSIWDGMSDGDIQKKLKLHVDNTDPKSKEVDILYEILLKAGFELSEKIEQVKIGDKNVYSVLEGQLLICLDKQLDKDFVRSLTEKKPKQFICLNSSFKEDADLTNTAKILENNQIEFRTI